MYLLFGLSHLIFVNNIAGKSFIIFELFCYFFRNLFAWVEYDRNSRLNFFSLFLGLSQPVLAKNNAGQRFFIFLNFFSIFFGIFLPGSSMNGIREYIYIYIYIFFFFHFFGLSHPSLAMNNAGKWIFNFLIFFISFLEFLAWFDYERNSGIKFFSRFLGLSFRVLAENIAGKKLFNFFAIFFAIFFTGWSMNGIRD